MHQICRHFFIHGKVQGVWFRAATKEQAIALGLVGWVKNIADGSVEVLVQGPISKIAKITQWLYQGPTGARVDVVIIEEHALMYFTEFIIHY